MLVASTFNTCGSDSWYSILLVLVHLLCNTGYIESSKMMSYSGTTSGQVHKREHRRNTEVAV